MPADDDDVRLVRATRADAPLLGRLLELYVHDLSAIFPVAIGPDGRFGYEHLPRYWDEPERRFAFVIRCGARVAGFALAMRGSPASDDPAALDVAEFFVLRGHRRGGVGRRAAFALWDALPGPWIVRVSERNAPGLAFWRPVVAAYTQGAFAEGARERLPGWRVFAFESAPR